MVAPIAVKSIMPAATSFAVFADSRHSVVTKSVTDSMAVFIISVAKPINVTKTKIVISIKEIPRKNPNKIAAVARKTWILKFGWEVKA